MDTRAPIVQGYKDFKKSYPTRCCPGINLQVLRNDTTVNPTTSSQHLEQAAIWSISGARRRRKHRHKASSGTEALHSKHSSQDNLRHGRPAQQALTKAHISPAEAVTSAQLYFGSLHAAGGQSQGRFASRAWLGGSGLEGVCWNSSLYSRFHVVMPLVLVVMNHDFLPRPTIVQQRDALYLCTLGNHCSARVGERV